MADVGSSLHEEELPDWMSQLFEKLDLEVHEDSVSTGKMAQVGTYPIVEEGISSEIDRKSQGKDSTVNVDALHENQSSDWISLQFGKSVLEANEDSIHSTERPPLMEGGIVSQIYSSSEEKDSTRARAKTSGVWFEDDDGYVNWIIKILKDGGHDDILSGYDPDEGEKHVHYDVQDELGDPIEMDNEAMDYCMTTKRVSKKETIKNGIKWMSEECFLAFTKYAEKINLEGIKHKFGELRYQCLSVEAYDRIFHHYNFTIETDHRSSDVSTTSELYFAEVKQMSGIKSYFCCPLEPNDEGHCYGCKNQDMYDLKHPSTGCYEEGVANICWPFMDDTDSDSDGI